MWECARVAHAIFRWGEPSKKTTGLPAVSVALCVRHLQLPTTVPVGARAVAPPAIASKMLRAAATAAALGAAAARGRNAKPMGYAGLPQWEPVYNLSMSSAWWWWG